MSVMSTFAATPTMNMAPIDSLKHEEIEPEKNPNNQKGNKRLKIQLTLFNAFKEPQTLMNVV